MPMLLIKSARFLNLCLASFFSEASLFGRVDIAGLDTSVDGNCAEHDKHDKAETEKDDGSSNEPAREHNLHWNWLLLELIGRLGHLQKLHGECWFTRLRHFALDLTASRTAQLTALQRQSVNTIFLTIRERISEECERASPVSRGEVEVDESYFGGKRKGRRGRGAAGKVPVFGLLRRNGRVYTRIVRDVSRKTLRQIIRTKVIPESVIYTDSFRSHDSLVIDGFKRYRINHQKAFVTSKRHHINGIENFWGYAKTKLKSYYEVSRNQFYFYLKEMEFRYNHRESPNLQALIKKIVRKHEAVLV